MKSFGICIGAVTLSTVGIERDSRGNILKRFVDVRPHNGNPRNTLAEVLTRISLDSPSKVAVTGRKFRHYLNLSSISEPEAVETALFHLNGDRRPLDAVVSAGAETFMVYILGEDGKIRSVQTGNKCASGTGEFFIQQLRRIGMSIEDAITYALREKPYRVSGRCSVFCKSDCTHATNKGVPKGRIAAGLCEMMAGKILELLKPIPRNDVMIIGGTAQNPVLVNYLKKEIKNVIVPEEAPYFEALGTALWALENDTIPLHTSAKIFDQNKCSFSFLPPLKDFEHMVDFKTMERGIARENDRCIIGLDVGSTTTKAIILRLEDHTILASVYLRTKGNPVEASRECYSSLIHQLGELADKIRIVGLGVTGSGRQIAGLHAMTEGIVNEIIAHAAAAIFFDQGVDTIFEIGGQDAKYTYIHKGTPSDYAMNDACSAGTGSFLEEAAKETMGIEMEEIGEIAMRGQHPPNFNDQCAAFISSDIKNATHEGMTREDIVAGLVYSICMNYNNRVKGNRTIGNNIFMQGGVCYNRAVPIAMAALTGKRIVVPPDPGLMGAFGVALEVERMIHAGLIPERNFSLKILRDRTIEYGDSFTCHGGKEKCDRKCEIARIIIENKVYPFGGACNKWYNVRFKINVDTEPLNFVRRHEELVFSRHQTSHYSSQETIPVIGINKSFLVNTYYPLYHHFFSRLGFRVILPDLVDEEGLDLKRAPFCYPAEIAHGFFANLLHKQPHYIFLPHLRGHYVEKGFSPSTVCPLLQGEPYYLSSAFKSNPLFSTLAQEGRILSPVIDFSGGPEKAEESFLSIARKLGASKEHAKSAFRVAVDIQMGVFREMKDLGKQFLKELEGHPDRFAVVLFGRSYNAIVSEANMGIPHKFASRGIAIIPADFLPLENEPCPEEMYWASGQTILKASSFIARHPQLFGCYITNFSCGPDSFLTGYFRDIMGKKPYLILELDSHVADAGLETRIEAFLDIIKNYRGLPKAAQTTPSKRNRVAIFDPGKQMFVDTKGREYPFHHPKVHLLFPSMGQFFNEAAAAIFRSMGIRSSALPPADETVFKLGRGNTSCKECLPLLLTVGSLLHYLNTRENTDELLVYFMPTASGPCRFGLYAPFINRLIQQQGIEDVVVFSLQAENSYSASFGNDLTLKLWSCLIIGDILQDLYSLILTNASDTEAALEVFHRGTQTLLKVFETSPTLQNLQKALRVVVSEFQKITMRRAYEETPCILLTGEIYVRHDNLSRQFLVEKLAQEGFVTKVASIMEWIYYTDWCFKKGVSSETPTARRKFALHLRAAWMKHYERALKKIVASSFLLPYRLEDVNHLIKSSRHVINPHLTGEAILTIGAALSEVPHPYCGCIAIGPFGCMPNRLSEAIISGEVGTEIPFLAIESDGNVFPQVITAKLEVFLMQALRVHQKMQQN